jgi:nodulation protein E
VAYQPGHRVAVTGLGAVTALGHDVAGLWDAACRGECGIGPIEGIPTARLLARTAAQVRGFDPAAHFERRRLPMLDRAAQLALVAAREAMADAGAAIADPARAGVILGAANGQETFDSAYLAFYGQNARGVPPLTIPRIMPSAATSQLSMEWGIRGPCFATASACASAAHAIGLAFHMVRAGTLDCAIVGGADASIVVGFIKGWEALRVLSPDVCRPFSRDRAGLVLGEGAAMLVLERLERARQRGARVHAELVGFGMSADAADLTAPDAAGAAAAMQAALDDAGLAPEAIGYVNAHGTGTRLNDATEAAALARVFGRPPPVSSSKSMLGHCMSACGAIELVLTVLALRDCVLPPTINFREADPDCALDCVANAARPAEPRAALSSSLAFGGLNAVLAAKRVAA